MTTPETDMRPSKPSDESILKRRGLLAGAVALVAGLVAKMSETTVSAGVDGDVVLGAANSEATTTTITNTTSGSTGMQVTAEVGTATIGLIGRGSGTGVSGVLSASGAADSAGVRGSGRANSYGVVGINSDGIAIRGVSSVSTGVVGESNSGIPVLGQVTNGSASNTIAVYALNNSTYAGPSPGAGGFGIYGLCAKGHGLVGATSTAGGAAVVGATNGVVGAYAAAFYGPVIVGGDFTVVGGAKSAAVPHPDGSHRRLYCVESPESWFEDFGAGRLECGRAEVTIDPDFAAMVDLTDYHVFLTELGEHRALAVSQRTPTGFTVQANAALAKLLGRSDAELSGTFSWRVVARRRDIRGERLAPVTLLPEPKLPPLPSV